MTDAITFSVFATFLLAGFVKGVTGMGLPTVAMSLLGTVMAPAAAASLLIVPSFVTNVWQLLSGADLRGLLLRLWPMLLGIVAGTVAGVSAITSKGGWIEPALGGTLLVYALVSLLAWQPSVPAKQERWLSPIIGLVTGLVTGATGIFVVPAVPYLQALPLTKDELVQALGLSFTISTIALACGLAREGAFTLGGTLASVFAVAPALVGMWLGGQLRNRIDAIVFRRWFLAGLAVLGVTYVIRIW